MDIVIPLAFITRLIDGSSGTSLARYTLTPFMGDRLTLGRDLPSEFRSAINVSPWERIWRKPNYMV